MMRCPDKSRLEDLLAARLPADQHAALEYHILNCEACRQVFERMSEPPDDFVVQFERMMQSVPEFPCTDKNGDSAGDAVHGADGSRMRNAHADGMLGEYLLVRRVGKGGMGVVFEAKDLRLRRRVAVKTLSFEYLNDPSRLKRFHNEARAAATLDQHPHIVTVYGVGEENGLHYYVMRFIDGYNLAEIYASLRRQLFQHRIPEAHAGNGRPARRIPVSSSATTIPIDRLTPAPLDSVLQDELIVTRDGNTPDVSESADRHSQRIELPQLLAKVEPLSAAYVRVIAKLGETAAKALAYAHAHGVVHRDIKPSNLMLDFSGQIWVTDFGLARIDTGSISTLSGPWCGTIRYMSPEQAVGPRGVADARSDIYSLGVTLYEMLTLQPLFEEESPQQVLALIPRQEARPPRSLNPNIPIDLETIILKALAKDPSDRYASAAEFAEDLNRFIEHRPIVARRLSLWERMGKWFKTHPRAFPAAACAIALLAAIGVLQAKLYIDQTRLVEELEFSKEQHAKTSRLAENHLYVANVSLAAGAIQEQDYAAAFDSLRRHLPGSGTSDDRRGFEWYWLFSKFRNRSGAIRLSQKALYQVVLSPNGELAAISGEDAVIRIIDTRFWETKNSFNSNQREVNGLAFSPDGQSIASGGDDGTVRVWDVSTGRERLAFRAHFKEVWGVAFSGNGHEIISTGTDDKVLIWSATTGDSVGWIPAHVNSVESVRVAPDGKTVVTSTVDDLFVWDLPTRKLRRALRGHSHRVPAFAFYNGGNRLISGSMDKTVRDWNLKNGKSRVIGKHLDGVISVAVSPDESTVATGDRGGVIQTWDLKSKEPPPRIAPIRSALAPDVVWDLTGEGRLVWSGMTSDASHLLAATPQRLLSRDLRSGAVQEIPLSDASILQKRRSPAAIHVVDISADDRWIVVFNEILRRDDSSTFGWKLHARIPRAVDEIHCVRFSPDGKRIAVGGDSGSIRLYDRENGQMIGALDERAGAPAVNASTNVRPPVVAIEFSADGRWLAANAGADGPGRINFWNLETGQRNAPQTEDEMAVRDLAFPRQGDVVAACSGQGRVQVWSHARAELQTEFLLDNPSRKGESLAASPDGRVIAVADRSGELATIGLLSLTREEEIVHIPGCASFLRFSSDSTKLMTGDQAGKVCLWNAERLMDAAIAEARKVRDDRKENDWDRHEWAASRVAHNRRAYSLVFTRDGSRIVSVGSDGVLQVAARTAGDELNRLSLEQGEFRTFSGFQCSAEGSRVVWHVPNELWVIPPDGKARRMPHNIEPLRTAAISPDGRQIAVLSGTSDLRILDAGNLTANRQLSIELDAGEEVEQVAFIPQTSLLLVRLLNEERQHRFYDLATGSRVTGYPESAGNLLAVARKRNRIAFARHRILYCIDIEPGAHEMEIAQLHDGLDGIALSDDGAVVAGCTAGRSVMVWDVDSRNLRIDQRRHRAEVGAVAISPDGRTLASGDQNGVVKLWDLQTGRHFYDLTKSGMPVGQIEFCGAGRAVFCRGMGRAEVIEFDTADLAITGH